MQKILAFLVAVLSAFNVAAQSTQSNTNPQKVALNESNCKKINGAYERFTNEIAQSISVPPNSIEVVGPTWNHYRGVQCTIIIKTPRGDMECAPGEIYTSPKGLSAAGTGFGHNASCSKLK